MLIKIIMKIQFKKNKLVIMRFKSKSKKYKIHYVNTFLI